MRNIAFGLAMTVIATLSPALSLAGEAEDQQVAHQIAANLKASGLMKHYEIRVTCENGTAWLSGTVASREQLTTALRLVRQTDGVEQVVDDLKVEGNSPEGFMHSIRRSSASDDLPPVRQTAASDMESAFEPRMAMHRAASGRSNRPLPYGGAGPHGIVPTSHGQPVPAYVPGPGTATPARYDNPQMPGYAWPSYAAYPNYGAVTYPKQYSPTAWPYIGPFYPYPQVPLGWRKVTLEWDDGWWMLDFKD